MDTPYSFGVYGSGSYGGVVTNVYGKSTTSGAPQFTLSTGSASAFTSSVSSPPPAQSIVSTL